MGCNRLSVVILMCVTCLLAAGGVGADSGPGYVHQAGMIRPGATTQVRMLSERVLFHNLNSRNMDVLATFELKNTGSLDETVHMFFPMCVEYDSTCEVSNVEIDIDGEVLPHQEKRIPYEDYGVTVQYWFSAPFPPLKTRHLQVRYTTEERYDSTYKKIRQPFVAFDYILQSGHDWKGTIGKGEIVVKLPYSPDSWNFSFTDWQSQKPHRALNNEYNARYTARTATLTFEDLEPEKAHDFGIVFQMPSTIESISRLEKEVTETKTDDNLKQLLNEYRDLVFDTRRFDTTFARLIDEKSPGKYSKEEIQQLSEAYRAYLVASDDYYFEFWPASFCRKLDALQVLIYPSPPSKLTKWRDIVFHCNEPKKLIETACDALEKEKNWSANYDGESPNPKDACKAMKEIERPGCEFEFYRYWSKYLLDCNDGKTDACRQMADVYNGGYVGVTESCLPPPDVRAALYGQWCDAINMQSIDSSFSAECCEALGELYRKGDLGEDERSQAMPYYQAACYFRLHSRYNRGDACVVYATMRLSQKEKETTEAADLLLKTCNRGNVEGCLRYAAFLEADDAQKAMAQQAMRSLKSFPDATQLGQLYRILKKMTSGGNLWARHAMAVALQHRRFMVDTPAESRQKALQHLLANCENGLGISCVVAANSMPCHDVNQSATQVARLRVLHKGCQLGNEDGCRLKKKLCDGHDEVCEYLLFYQP